MQLSEPEACAEAILFASGEAIGIKELAQTLEINTKDCKKLMNNLIEKYRTENRGIRIIEIEEAYQMCTNKDYFEKIKSLCAVEKKKTLTPTLLETLAIVAYKQPVTRAEIEAIRGVNAEHAVNTLMKYGLICEKGRMEAPGRPILFGTTEEFLRYFGFSGIGQLPDIENINIENIKEETEE